MQNRIKPNGTERLILLELRLDADTPKLRQLRARLAPDVLELALETAANAVASLPDTLPIAAALAVTEAIVEGFAAAAGLL